MSRSAATFQRRRVVTSAPITALTTKTADSHTRRAPSASAMKLGSPGVSRRLILRPDHSKELSAIEIDIWRACSSASISEAVVPSTTVPRRVSTPASNKSASCSDVLPAPRWPTKATLRIASALYPMRVSSPSGRSTYRDAAPAEGFARAQRVGTQPSPARSTSTTRGSRRRPDSDRSPARTSSLRRRSIS